MDEQLPWAGVEGQAAAVREGRVSSRELTEALLRRIQRYDGRLNAFTVVFAERALAEADARDAVPRDGRGPCTGCRSRSRRRSTSRVPSPRSAGG